MIFLTVGSHTPFDRLTKLFDCWLGSRPGVRVVAQLGESEYQPANFPWVRRMDSADYAQTIRECDLIVSHAGMGTIISALQLGKPLIALPRRGDMGETRNEHQSSTARAFSDRIHVAWDKQTLFDLLDRRETLAAAPMIGPHAQDSLLRAVRAFLAR